MEELFGVSPGGVISYRAFACGEVGCPKVKIASRTTKMQAGQAAKLNFFPALLRRGGKLREEVILDEYADTCSLG